jgi:hypothetical protein
VATIAVVLPVIALLVIVLLLVEVRQYRAGRTLISRRRLVLRLVAGLLMIGLVAAIFVGLFLLGLWEVGGRPGLFLAYWCGCLMISIALMWIMLADMREVGDRFSRRQHEIWRDMAKFVAGSTRRNGEKPGCCPHSEGKE